MMNTFTEFFNKLQMTSFGAFANQGLSVWCIVYFSLKAGKLLDSVSTIVGVAQSQHSYGFQIFCGIMGYLGYKVTVNAASNHGIRTTSREYKAGEASIAEATERGKIVGEAQAKVVEIEAVERQARLTGAFKQQATGEHEAPPLKQEVNVNVGGDVPPLVADPPVSDDHEWKEGDPRAGVL